MGYTYYIRLGVYQMSRQDKPNVYVRARLTHVTEKAIQLQPANRKEKYWLPKSQVVNIDMVIDYLTSLPSAEAEIEYVDLEVKEWICTKNGIPTIDDTGEEEEDFDFDEGF